MASDDVMHAVEERLRQEVGALRLKNAIFAIVTSCPSQLEHAARVVWGPDSCSCMPCVLAACGKALKLVAVDPAYVAARRARASR
jgi:hypothetical protein